MSVRIWLLAIGFIAINWSLLPAQEPEPPKSTAQVGQMLPGPFPSYNVTGNRAKTFHCLVTDPAHELNPTVAVFCVNVDAKQPPDPLKNLLTKLEAMTDANKGAKFGAFAIFLNLEKEFYQDNSREGKIADLEGLSESLKLKNVVLGLERPDCPAAAGYGIGKDDRIVVLVYYRYKVAARFTFTDKKPMAEGDVTAILDAAAKTLPEKK
ncbi:MAG TPA: hypothetical protein VGZ47_20610 [Gemmataceae bacterium]|nr:hypothetical protein [Gemmataceae bacterium]